MCVKDKKSELYELAAKKMGFVLMTDSTTTIKIWAEKISNVYDVVENKKNKEIYNLLKNSKGKVERTRYGTIKIFF